ncbi:MAG: hypothetical protein ACYS17_01990 [Planctomycetota bacterium]
MVKKCIIALAVAALLATTVQAADPSIKRDFDWPFTYKPIGLCKMDVFMDIGHFVQMKDCNKRELEMKQVNCESIGEGSDDFPCYDGCEEFEVRANFPAVFGGELTNKSAVFKEVKVYFKDGDDQINGSTGDWEKVTICVKAWKTEIWKADEAKKKQKVADLTVTVKPPDSDA